MPLSYILGQEQPKHILKKALEFGSLPHAYLFYGPESVGKKLTAIELAKILNCTEKGPLDRCNTCPSCRKIEARTHPDFFLIEPEKTASGRDGQIKIEQIRDLQKKLVYLPYEGRVKVAVVDSAESLNLQAANSFLKTLEEPPSDTLIILVANNLYQLLPTIISRCQGIKFLSLRPEAVQKILTRKVESGDLALPLEELELRAARSRGRVHRAVEQDLERVQEYRNELLDLVEGSSFENMGQLFEWTRNRARQTEDLQDLLNELLTLIRDLAVLKRSAHPQWIFNRDLLDRLTPLAEQKSLSALLKMFDAAHRTKGALNANLNAQLTLDNMLISFCEAA
ncbi:MAG: DNA polymerase III subunit delta' [Nitrospinae bacterium CG11_big_fil_rev_8_21_14_0_20_56_8]|nr:MAG: DNA polymerase III subunit delta' [Nitrospinae bacterium CG11_big_fil_rev_8_21_14_0_20_56_8]